MDWKSECVQGLRVRHLLNRSRAWKQQGLVNLLRLPGKFSALDYHQGHIAGGTIGNSTNPQEDNTESVVVWSVEHSRVFLTFPVSSTVSCIKLHFPHLVVCGHFDGSISSFCVGPHSFPWGGELLSPQPPGSLLQKYYLHTSPVLSVDLSLVEDLLVSGSADWSSKVWCLSSGQLLKTLESDWFVLSCILRPSSEHTVGRFRGRHLLLTMSKFDIQLWSWEAVESPNPGAESLSLLVKPSLCIPLYSDTEDIPSPFFLTPSLHFDGQNISFIRQRSMFGNQGSADIVILSADTGEVVHNVHVNHKIKKLLALGKRYAVLLLPDVDFSLMKLAVVDLVTREIVGGFTVPHSQANSPNFNHVIIGDPGWLNGLSSSVTDGLVACIAQADSSINLVTWESTV